MRLTKRRYDRRPLIAAALAVIAIVIVGVVDFSITSDKVPGVPAGCPTPGSEPCESERNEEFEERFERAIELEEDFDQRAWIYGGVAFLVVLAGVGVATVRTDPSVRREIFTDLGVGSVLALGLGLVLAAGGSGLIQTPTKPVLYPQLGWLAVALVGTVLTRRPTPAADDVGDATPAEPLERRGRILVYAGLGIAAAAIILALLSFSGRDDPCVSEVPGWVESFAALSAVLAAIAFLCGLATLAMRRWITALVMLGPAPVFALLALFGTACWN